MLSGTGINSCEEQWSVLPQLRSFPPKNYLLKDVLLLRSVCFCFIYFISFRVGFSEFVKGVSVTSLWELQIHEFVFYSWIEGISREKVNVKLLLVKVIHADM